MSEFIAKDGRAVVVRELRLEDLDGLLELVPPSEKVPLSIG
jgi:hypothetical protein